MSLSLGFIFCLVWVALMPVAAHAYIDPGSGSLMVQMLLGTIVSAGVSVLLWWRAIVKRVRSGVKRLLRKTPGRGDA